MRGISLQRLRDRQGLLQSFDNYRRTLEATAAVEGMDEFSRRAFEVLSSSKLVDALDVTREDPRLRAKYGIGDMKNIDDGPPCCMDQFLMARRLVEAGVRCVTIGFGRWDYHDRNFKQCRDNLPKLDMALSALVEDLHMRGLDKDVSVVVWGEFGRTPKINPQGGRDHWPNVSCAILAGGGMRMGQVIGKTNRLGRNSQGTPRHLPKRLRHPLPAARHRPWHDPLRSRWVVLCTSLMTLPRSPS